MFPLLVERGIDVSGFVGSFLTDLMFEDDITYETLPTIIVTGEVKDGKVDLDDKFSGK